MFGQCARVDSLNAKDVVALEVVFQRLFGTPIARHFTEFLDDEASDVRFVALAIELIDPVVPNHRVSHGHHLAAVGGISEHLLITCHGGIETHFTKSRAGGPEGLS